MKQTHRVALITGGARRIGAGISEGLHEHGYDIVVHYRHSGDAARMLVDRLNHARPDSCLGLQANLADPAARSRLAAQACAWKNRLDVLVNNASAFYPSPLDTATEAQWDELFASNVRAPYFLARDCLPFLREHQGCIINMIDAMVQRPARHYNLYSMAKAALQSMTLALAKELAPAIRVNAISPGAILWPENDTDEDRLMQEKILAGIPLGRQGEVGDITRTLLFLVQEAPYITGQVIAVDGGRSL